MVSRRVTGNCQVFKAKCSRSIRQELRVNDSVKAKKLRVNDSVKAHTGAVSLAVVKSSEISISRLF